MHPLLRRIARQDGTSAVEYGLLAGLIAAVIMVAVTLFGHNVSALYMKAANMFP
jgi:pilus assembly protein Flp/PilA